VQPTGTRRRLYRQVLAPAGAAPRSLTVGLAYDGANGSLI
jgi:hypothetical protein